MTEQDARELLAEEYKRDGHPHYARVLRSPLHALPYTDQIGIRLLMLIPKVKIKRSAARGLRQDLAFKIMVGVWGQDLAEVYERNGDMRHGEALKAADAALAWFAEGKKL